MSTRPNNPPGFTDFALLVTLSALFGASFMFTHWAVAEIPPLTVAASRVFIALLILLPLMLQSGQRLPRIGIVWLPAIASATLGYALPLSLVSWGQLRVQASLAAIFMAIMPLATVVLAHLFTRDEKLNRWKLAGVLCGLVGVVVLFGIDTLGNIGDADALSQLAILAAAVCYAINAIITRALVDVPRLPMLVVLMLVCSLIMVPISLIVESPYSHWPSWQALASVLILAVGPTAIATLLILVIVARQGASFISQINFMVPLFGVFLGWSILGERLSPDAWIALALVLLGIALSRRGNTHRGNKHRGNKQTGS